MARYDERLRSYLGALYGEDRRRFACRARTPEEVAAWQREARPALRGLVGLDRIEEAAGGFQPRLTLSAPEDLGDYTRRAGILETEPDFDIPFWLLRPKGAGPFPLGIFPHGHKDRGMDSYVGITHSDEERRTNEEEERDVAVQAVRQGFVAVAPTTRGFEPAAIADLSGRHGGRNCRSLLMHSLLAGRTATGQRVWDLGRLLDWACGLPEVDADRVLMMGNSGGGVATLYAAACDTRIKVAVPSCSFCTLVGRDGKIHHCDCNAVPGILAFGEFHDVAGLIAPRHLLAVNGTRDELFPLSEVDRVVQGVGRIYSAAGVPERFAHRYGEGGHRFYSELMWPFVRDALSIPAQTARPGPAADAAGESDGGKE